MARLQQVGMHAPGPGCSYWSQVHSSRLLVGCVKGHAGGRYLPAAFDLRPLRLPHIVSGCGGPLLCKQRASLISRRQRSRPSRCLAINYTANEAAAADSISRSIGEEVAALHSTICTRVEPSCAKEKRLLKNTEVEITTVCPSKMMVLSYLQSNL